MILGFLRLAVFGFLALSVIYVLVSIYARSVEKERLEKQYDAGEGQGDRDAFIEAGMAAYRSGLRRKLLWLIYIVPMCVMTGLIYILNFS